MKDYIILKTNNNTNPYVCFIKTIDDVYFMLDDIKNDIKKLNIDKIVVDLLLTNGYEFNRFFEMKADENNNYIAIINSRFLNEDTIYTINQYLLKNINVLKQSALSLKMIDIIISQLKINKNKPLK